MDKFLDALNDMEEVVKSISRRSFNNPRDVELFDRLMPLLEEMRKLAGGRDQKRLKVDV